MDRIRVNQVSGIVPLAFSAVAFAIVVANILAGVPRQPDEGASAHIWQLLVAGQIPFILVSAATADWRGRHALVLLGVQLLALMLACAPVLLAGY